MAQASSIQKIAQSRPDTIYLITQDGDGEIDRYSIVLSVPADKHSAFQKACGKGTFNAETYGKILYYSAGELSLADCQKLIKDLPA